MQDVRRGKASVIIDCLMPECQDAPKPIRIGGGYVLGWIEGSGPVVWGGPFTTPSGRVLYEDELPEEGIIRESDR